MPKHPKKSRRDCSFPLCDLPMRDRHHIIYEPKPFCVSLCRRHHWEITICNINEAEKTHRKLSNGQRWRVYRAWMAGDIEPILTEHAKKWMASWDGGKEPDWKSACSVPVRR